MAKPDGLVRVALHPDDRYSQERVSMTYLSGALEVYGLTLPSEEVTPSVVRDFASRIADYPVPILVDDSVRSSRDERMKQLAKLDYRNAA